MEAVGRIWIFEAAASMVSEVKIDVRFELRDTDYPQLPYFAPRQKPGARPLSQNIDFVT